MKIKSKVKKKKSKKLKAPALLKGSLTKLACRDEVIWELFSECLKTEKDKDATRDIKIYLQNVDFPVSVNYKTDFLDDLKRKRIIKDYKLKIEEEKLPPIIFEESLEPNVGLLPLASFKELKSAPKKYKAVNHAENGYVAIVKCNPQKVIKYLKNDFKRVEDRAKKEKLEKIQKSIKPSLLITKDSNGDLYYKNKAIKFENKKAIYYLIFECLYKKGDLNGFCSYETISKYLEEHDKIELTDNQQIKDRLKNGIESLFRFSDLPRDTPDGKKLIQKVRGEGIILYNPSV